MSRPSRRLDYETVGKAKGGPLPKMRERRRHSISVLKDEVPMVEEHVNRSGDLCGRAFVDGVEHPKCLGEHEVRDPGSGGNEILGGLHLPGVIPFEQPDENVGVSGAHAAGEWPCEYLA